jgi:hypothetical protein
VILGRQFPSLYWLFGHSYLAVCIVQSLIGAAAAAAVYVIGKPVFGAAASLIAVLFAAISFPLAFWAAAIGYQTLDIGLTVFLVWLLIRAVERWSGTWWVWAIAGVAFGCAISVRETASTFLAFACAWALWAIPRRRSAERWRAVVVMSAAAVLVSPMVAPMVASSSGAWRCVSTSTACRRATRVGPRGSRPNRSVSPGRRYSSCADQPGFVVQALVNGVVHTSRCSSTQPHGAFDLVTLRKGTDYYFAVWCYAYLLTVVGTSGGAPRPCRRPTVRRAGDDPRRHRIAHGGAPVSSVGLLIERRSNRS